MTLRLLRSLAASALAVASWATPTLLQAQPVKRVALQGFWWNYRNNNYPQGWANYLIDLAPRLRAIGVQAVWVPPSIKNANPFSVGYSPFDHYDLGDKFQKGNLKTPFGDKDEYLRMVAVLHANGIEVMEDMVLNHMDGAGSSTGAGAIDPAYTAWYNSLNPRPADPTGGNKTFRYSCFATPVADETATDYLSRQGRFPKNWRNFYPNPVDARPAGDDLTNITFGPDIAYGATSFGQATNAGFDPVQTSGWMRNNMRNWAIWYKKQVGFDGVRLDAVKHFPNAVAEDLLWNMMYNAGFANGGDNFLAVGEWVGGKSEIDAWTDAVQGRAGTFDFSLRGFDNTPGLRGLVYGQGNYDMGNLPGLQQNRRDRTFPFVNNHDTFRPTLLANGDLPPANNWRPNGELAPFVDPREPRLAAAYAVALAVDGNPVVFMEDLFDLGSRGRRYTHLPASDTSLPFRDDVANLIACHNRLGFKQGAYLVPWQSADHLIIERQGRAIIGVTDNWNTWQSQWITTQFAPGTRLIDYGGSSGATDIRTVAQDRRVQISTPPCNGTARRRGYSVWAPIGQNINSFNPAPLQTVQEWELADDLGDSHPRSLGQGGALPANSRALRYAGKIYPDGGTLVRADLFVSDTTRRVALLVLDRCGRVLDSAVGNGPLVLRYTPPTAGWIQLAARNAAPNNPSQRVWIKATYVAPSQLDARANPSYTPTTADLGADRTLCRFTGTLTAFTGPGFTYRWADSTGRQVGTNATLAPPYAGLFSVVKTNTTSGCTATDTVRVTQLVDLPVQPIVRQVGDTLRIDAEPGVTYQWLRNGAVLAGATGSFFVPTQNGTYNVRATNGAGCGINGRSLDFVVSLQEALAAGIELAPNPTPGQVQLRLSGLAAAAISLQLVAPDGRRIPLPAASTLLDLSTQPAGVYTLEVLTPQGIGRKRVVKQ